MKRASSKSKESTKRTAIKESETNVSGGVNVEADKVEVMGDVVGHDKIEVEAGAVVVETGGRLTSINVPRPVQIAIGVGVMALIALVIVAIVSN